MKTVTIDGRRYKVEVCPTHNRLYLSGKGLLFQCCWLREGVTLDSPNLRDEARAALDAYRTRKQAASEAVQNRVREGRAGLGHLPPQE